MRRKDRSRDRTREYRERLREKQETAAEERAIRDHLWFFGEVTPRIDARTHAEELEIHREFLRALREPDVQSGETLRDVARRTWAAWTKGTIHDGADEVFCPGFNRDTQQWNPTGEGFVVKVKPFDEVWVSPADCENGEADKPVDINGLPKLPKLDVKKIRIKCRITAKEQYERRRKVENHQ
jgi:hypothetical protein